MTKHEAAVIMAYTGYTLLAREDFRYFHKYVEELMGFPVYTHELAMHSEEIKEKAEPEFLKICQSLTEETVKENKELVDAALRLKAYCTDHGGNCGGCPFFRPFVSRDLAINDCRLCDVYPEKWEISEVIADE